MNGKTGPKKLYFGWWLVVCGFLVLVLVGAPAVNLAGLFVTPLSEGFGVPRTAAAAAITVAALASMVMALFTGRIFSRFSFKVVVTISIIVIAGCYFLFSVSNSLTVILVGTAVRGAANALATIVPLQALINNWFGKKVRGRVWGIAVIGTGAGAMIFAPITAYIIETWGWRYAYGLYGILALVCIPLVLATYVRSPADKGLERFGDEDPADGKVQDLDMSGIPVRPALRSGMFWALMLACMLLAGGVQIWLINGASYMTDLGYEVMWASLILSFVSVALTVGKLIVGTINDRASTWAATLFSSLCLMAGFLVALLLGRGSWVAYPMAILIGFGQTLTTVIIPLVTRDLMGNRDYVSFAGFSQAAMALGFFVAPMAASLVYDLMGSYTLAWVGVVVTTALGAVCVGIAYRLQPALMAKFGGAPKGSLADAEPSVDELELEREALEESRTQSGGD